MPRAHQPGKADGERVAAYPPGSVIVLPGNTYHFHWARSGEYVNEMTALGPPGLEYLDPGDDPTRPKITGRAGASAVTPIRYA